MLRRVGKKDGMTTNCRLTKNAFSVSGIIIFFYILCIFLSGSLVKEKLYGTWTAVEIYDEITFAEKTYTHGNETGEYTVRGNQIIFSNGEQCKITLTKHYLQLNEIYYMKE